MIYYFRSARYETIVDRHNDLAYDVRNDLLSDEYFSDSGSEGSTCESEDSSLEGRRRWRPTRFTNYSGKVPKKHRTRWRDSV
jgi:hypothetical protein